MQNNKQIETVEAVVDYDNLHFTKEFIDLLVKYNKSEVGVEKTKAIRLMLDLILRIEVQSQQEAVKRERERLQPVVEIAEAIADLTAFDKETGYIWQHWIEQAQKVVKALKGE